MSREKYILPLLAFAACLLHAAPEPGPAFEKVPKAALNALRISRGKVINTGMVFVNGKLLPGPYIVSRYGTAIRINSVQVTGPLVPWVQFTTAAGNAPAARAPAAPPPAAAPAPAAKPVSDSSVDDLFGDAPAPAPAQAAPRAAAPAAPAAAPVPEGRYADTPRSKALLKRINDYRTDLDRLLRGNGVLFFSTRHSPVRIDSRLAQGLLDVLPNALRDANDARELQSILRAKGITYLPAAACAEMIRDRALYMKVRDRMREIKEEQAFRKMLGNAGKGS